MHTIGLILYVNRVIGMFVAEIKMQILNVKIFIHYEFFTKMIQKFMLEKMKQCNNIINPLSFVNVN